jgi:hypothetical protein
MGGVALLLLVVAAARRVAIGPLAVSESSLPSRRSTFASKESEGQRKKGSRKAGVDRRRTSRRGLCVRLDSPPSGTRFSVHEASVDHAGLIWDLAQIDGAAMSANQKGS